jgi:hypothetical protein
MIIEPHVFKKEGKTNDHPFRRKILTTGIEVWTKKPFNAYLFFLKHLEKLNNTATTAAWPNSLASRSGFWAKIKFSDW